MSDHPQPGRTAKTIPSLRHEAAIPIGHRTRGFAAALRNATGVSLGRQGRIVPDAFKIDVDNRTVELFRSAGEPEASTTRGPRSSRWRSRTARTATSCASG